MADAEFWSMSYNPSYLLGWWLGGIRDSDGHHIDDRAFQRGERLCDPAGLILPLYPFGEQRRRARLPLQVAVTRPGRRTDLSIAGSGAWVVTDRLARVFRDRAADDIELLPLAVGEEVDPAHYVLNIARLVDAIDLERSSIEYWPADAPAGKAGNPFHVSRLQLRTEAAKGMACFRLYSWSVQPVVSSEMMAAIRASAFPEIVFEGV